jgi:putative heme-binding domain-containing protein
MKTRVLLIAGITLSVALINSSFAAPQLLDDQFTLPAGFHIYKVAERELTGGSYDLVFDGSGQLLVGDGKNLRRLTDSDGDQVYDRYDVIAEGLGGRGPQGLVVYGDYLYAVGGDGIQLFSGYLAGGKLQHERRLGTPFSTGGDHSAHTILRGLDGCIYFVTGDGGGAADRKHITEESSPVLFERNASVFRFDPTGTKWECISAGGRNPPSLGMNYLGEFFSFDSDMEFHVDVPFYRPVSLNHWATGGDNGWQSVGAYPRYFIDCHPAVLEVGRGSPNWGIFYEHSQFPKAYHDAFIVCDYQWKSATSGRYANPGRLLTFHLERRDAAWHAKMTLLAQPKKGAVDANDTAINFGLVDVDVAPDGSIVFTDHNQGVWRMFYDPSPTPKVPKIVPDSVNADQSDLDRLLSLPQPMAEWSRAEEERIIKGDEIRIIEQLHIVALNPKVPLRKRLRALRLLSSRFETLDGAFVARLAGDNHAEVRGQAAWLVGLQKKDENLAVDLLDDKDPFVRRRAAEALSRFATAESTGSLTHLLSDKDRSVRYAAMTTLAHRPTSELMAAARQQSDLQTLLRLLVATHIRRERAAPDQVHAIIGRMFDLGFAHPQKTEDALDLLRVLGLFRPEIEKNEALAQRIKASLLDKFPNRTARVRWEQIRLLGEYDCTEAFGPLLSELEKGADDVNAFHVATAIAKISKGWTDEESRRLVRRLLSTQTGWFAEHAGKGLQFPGFWATVLNHIAAKHAEAFIELADGLQLDSQLGPIAFKAIIGAPKGDEILLKAFRSAKDEASRKRILSLLQQVSTPATATALLEFYERAETSFERESYVPALAAQVFPPEKSGIFVQALLEVSSAQAIEYCAKRLIADGHLLAHYAATVQSLKLESYHGEQAVLFRLIELMSQHPAKAPTLERALQTLANDKRQGVRAPLQCIWTSDQQVAGEHAWFAKSFSVSNSPTAGVLIITCDNEFVAWINGKKVGQSKNWGKPQRLDVSAALKPGKNLIAIRGLNQGGPAGLAARLRWTQEDGNTQLLTTDTSWKVASTKPAGDWRTADPNAAGWQLATDVSKPTKNVMTALAAFFEKNPVVSAEEIQEYWQDWYRGRFSQPFTARLSAPKGTTVRSDETLHTMILTMKEFTGDAAKGRQVYLRAGCFACHGGAGNNTGTIFGPTLAGATLRLNRQELADSLIYPSKQVSERFKAIEVNVKDGETINGFLTEQSDEFISVTDLQNNITRLPRKDVESIRAQESSLMPSKLLNTFSDAEIKNLMAFIHGMK